MAEYDFGSTGIQIKGGDSYHVVKVHEKDEWLLLRRRDGSFFQAAIFVSPDEARAFVNACDLTLDKLK
jgi:uroporphyrinogen-III synthase